ncbi:hypothetical protein C0J52_22203 [Blattella germanica]|nr:hypothetical protein C0J52_22203 [Blattella germanica]
MSKWKITIIAVVALFVVTIAEDVPEATTGASKLTVEGAPPALILFPPKFENGDPIPFGSDPPLPFSNGGGPVRKLFRGVEERVKGRVKEVGGEAVDSVVDRVVDRVMQRQLASLLSPPATKK